MKEFERIYSDAVKAVRDLIEDVRFGRRLILDPIQNCAQEICTYGHLNSNFLALLNKIQDKNLYMYAHPVNVAFIANVIGKWMNLSRLELFHLVCTGILHDLGKAKVRDSILNKPGKLTETEMETIKTHPIKGFSILAELNVFPTEVVFGVLTHHERLDGSGYPMGLKGEQINLYARIIAIADIYDAMTSEKPYNCKYSPFKVIEEIAADSFGSLDPQICQVFLDNVSNFYPGRLVRLNNKQVGEIIYIYPGERTRPIIRCGEEYFDLAHERSIEIVEML